MKLFKGLEAFDRKPPEKSIVQKVANAYEILGLPEEKERVLEKYSDLFTETRSSKKFRKASSKKMKSGKCSIYLVVSSFCGRNASWHELERGSLCLIINWKS